MKIYHRAKGLKRKLEMDDFVKIPPPIEDSNYPETNVKMFSENIYIPEIGCYVIVVWDFQANKPSLLILNHTIFAFLKRWRADAMQDIVGKTFCIASKTNNEGVVYHDLYHTGLLPLMTEEIIDVINQYIDDLFETEVIQESE